MKRDPARKDELSKKTDGAESMEIARPCSEDLLAEGGRSILEDWDKRLIEAEATGRYSRKDAAELFAGTITAERVEQMLGHPDQIRDADLAAISRSLGREAMLDVAKRLWDIAAREFLMGERHIRSIAEPGGMTMARIRLSAMRRLLSADLGATLAHERVLVGFMVRMLDELDKWSERRRNHEVSYERTLDEANTSRREQEQKDTLVSMETCDRRIERLELGFRRALRDYLDFRRLSGAQIVNNGQMNFAERQINVAIEPAV